ncbi:MAG TPA: histidine kinase [Solirubrobacteraceae bacterium]|nr:histidine kinase [Solirubrobacteraceae bacterium]
MQPFRTLVAHVRALPPRVFDAWLAVLLLAEGLAELVLLTPIEGADLAIGAAVVVVMTSMLGLRRRLPVTALATQFTGFIVMTELAGRGWEDHIAGPFFWILIASYNLGARTEGRHLWAGVITGTALSCVSTYLDSYANEIPSFVNAVALSIAGPVLFARIMRNRARLNHALREKARALGETRASAAASAALEERTRIAGELHDVVAHALSAMTVQATAARRLAERDPASAEAAFATVEATGREALTELRRLLGVLRREDEELGLAPQPSLAHVGSLVRRSRVGGLPVELLVEGEPRPLPAGVDLTAYRLVQEALVRARDAEAGRAAAILDYGPSDLRVEITDDGAPVGRRLLGLRERVAVYGGQLQAGTTGDGGWRVAARLPIGRAEAAPGASAVETLA